MCGSDGERDVQEEAAQLEAHPSFAAVLGRRCLVPSGDRYLCILRRSLLAAKRPMIGYAGALRGVMPLRSNRSCTRASRASDQHPPSTARWSANTRRAGCETARSRRRVSVPQAATSRSMGECLLWARRVARLPSAGRNDPTSDKTLDAIERMLVGDRRCEAAAAVPSRADVTGHQQTKDLQSSNNRATRTMKTGMQVHCPRRTFCRPPAPHPR